jgi:KDO2-lipid IV(A) lauroyltransferase
MPERCIPLVAGALAPVHFLAFPERRRAVLANLASASDKGRLRRALLGVSVCANYNAYLIEFLRLRALTPADLRARTALRGDEHVQAAMASGRGIVFTTSHVGNWEWFAAYIAGRGRMVTSVAGVQLGRSLHAYVEEMKLRHKVEVVQPEDGYRTLYRRLERGGIVGLTLDGDIFQTGRSVRLFGRPTLLGSGAARLAQRTGSVLLYGTMSRSGPLRFLMEVEPPVGGLETERLSVDELDEELRRIQERHIRAHLDQWCLFRPLWPARSMTARVTDATREHELGAALTSDLAGARGA